MVEKGIVFTCPIAHGTVVLLQIITHANKTGCKIQLNMLYL